MKRITLLATLMLAVASVVAQQNIGKVDVATVSPCVVDNDVEFLLDAPNAGQVLLRADWMQAPVPMTRRESDNKWYYKSENLAPGSTTARPDFAQTISHSLPKLLFIMFFSDSSIMPSSSASKIRYIFSFLP